MAFKLKDLIISLLPPGEVKRCPDPSADFRPEMRAKVLFCKTASPAIIVMPEAMMQGCPDPSAGATRRCESAGPDGLAALQQQLEQILAQGGEQEAASEEPQLPQTLAEAEELEARLREALEELQRHKEGLR